MENKTIIEKMEHIIKTSKISSSYFKSKCDRRSNSRYESFFYIPDYHKEYLEDDFNYCMFSLYCFFDYTIEDVYELVCSLSTKYHKSDLFMLSYTDFVDYFEVHKFRERKKSYIKTSDEYKEKVSIKENTESDKIIHLNNDYQDTLMIIDSLNQDIKDICNDEDISPEKRISLINQYSKVSLRLNEKRFDLIDKISRVKL